LSIVIVKRFQTENIKVHPSTRLPFPLEFCNHNVVLENHSGGATRLRKKFDDIFIHFDTIPACDRRRGDDSNLAGKNLACVMTSATSGGGFLTVW